MTFTQITTAYQGVCRGNNEPVLIQLSNAAFADVARLVAPMYTGLLSQVINIDVFRQILRQGWFNLYGCTVVADKNLFHHVNLIRFWMKEHCELKEVQVSE